MQLQFFGSTASIPDPHEDSPCFAVNDCLFDCGWNVIGDMRETGFVPASIRTICFTHIHHDHIMGLPSLLFYFIHSKTLSLDQLTIVGPAETLEQAMQYAYQWLQLKKFYPDIPLPKLLPLHPGDSFSTDTLDIRATCSQHPTAALSYRLTDKLDKTVLACSGDGAYLPHMAKFYAHADALIHDSTLGNWIADDDPTTRGCGHSSLWEAVKAAEDADIPLLFPVHMGLEKAKEAYTQIQPTTKVKIQLPKRGEIIHLQHHKESF